MTVAAVLTNVGELQDEAAIRRGAAGLVLDLGSSHRNPVRPAKRNDVVVGVLQVNEAAPAAAVSHVGRVTIGVERAKADESVAADRQLVEALAVKRERKSEWDAGDYAVVADLG